MYRAMKAADLGRNEMSEHLDLDVRTVSRYLHDHVRPSVPTLRTWALRCGVPYSWLLTGDATTCGYLPVFEDAA